MNICRQYFLLKLTLILFKHEERTNYVEADTNYQDESFLPTLCLSPANKLTFESNGNAPSSSPTNINYLKAYLNLTNVSETSHKVFKIKSNLNSLMLRALPAQGILYPNESLTIRFRLYTTSLSLKQQEDLAKSNISGKIVIKYVNCTEEEIESLSCNDYLASKWKNLNETRLHYLKLGIDIKGQENKFNKIKSVSTPVSTQMIKELK